ncbi:DUF4145 domain-containing protein [Pelagicoccus sp. SDUM812002]|uniref:DUF4145 domain-containing protein n=1 Tax=Pelagicoccus sp. SDUM812002 TaxID=3041266 RepID=UPI0028102B4C|nr:DUF4145 domain-containing protein [Pelagicoccus sp. SDUM812002]MDQ8188543.1 DUF4145 domain-containing protein [Pelagicoccus sp. SDUM812002]
MMEEDYPEPEEFDETDFDKTKGRKLKVLCVRCEGKTNHTVLQSVIRNISENYMNWSGTYEVIQCLGCESISFREEIYFSELAEPWPGGSNGIEVSLYPKRTEHTRPQKPTYHAPPTVRKIYKEVIDCYNNESYILCAAGLRAMVEGICASKGIKKGKVEITLEDETKQTKTLTNIQGKISGLFEQGYLTKDHSDILHEHRFLGNEAVHELSSPTPEELNIAIDILEHTLEALFNLPRQAIDLKNHRSRRKNKT